MKRFLKIGIPIIVVMLALGGFGFWWFVLRDDAPPPAALPTRPVEEEGGAGVDGTWTIQPAADVFAGYRVTELFAGETIKKTAVGRSPAVTGTITVAGSRIETATIDVDMTKLTSDRSQRDNRLRNDGLETDTFPTATFRLTQPVDLGGPPTLGQEVAVKAAGDLTLHGVTKPVTLDLTAQWNGSTITVKGGTPIVMADYQINPPSVGGFVSVDDRGELEVALAFVKT